MSAARKENIIMVDSRLEKIIPQFLAQQKTDFEAIEQALKTLNYEELVRLGHRMKGSCGGYGFHELGRLGGLVEAAAQSKNSDSLQNYIDLIREQLFHTQISFEKK